MKILLLIAFGMLLLFSPVFRCFATNPFKTVFYGLRDTYFYFVHKLYNNAPSGFLDCYTGLFGKGKTLSAVHRVTSYYNRYNNKKVWSDKHHKFVVQQVMILSNVNLLSVPYTPLESLQQVVDFAKNYYVLNDDEHTFSIICLIDEASVQLNSRNFKSNINAFFLNTLLTCRHYKLGFILTSQRFNHMDALLRQVTQHVIECNKMWRFCKQTVYDAFEVENANNPVNIKPKHKLAWFVRNKDYAAYDTLACVGQLEKDCRDGNMFSDQEILNQLALVSGDDERIIHKSFRGRLANKKK